MSIFNSASVGVNLNVCKIIMVPAVVRLSIRPGLGNQNHAPTSGDIFVSLRLNLILMFILTIHVIPVSLKKVSKFNHT